MISTGFVRKDAILVIAPLKRCSHINRLSSAWRIRVWLILTGTSDIPSEANMKDVTISSFQCLSSAGLLFCLCSLFSSLLWKVK